MPEKKPYNAAERFQEVRRRAEAQDIRTGRRKPGAGAPPPPDADAYPTRPGASMRVTGDVHLADESAAMRALKRKGR